jgi:hypothetical protein
LVIGRSIGWAAPLISTAPAKPRTRSYQPFTRRETTHQTSPQRRLIEGLTAYIGGCGPGGSPRLPGQLAEDVVEGDGLTVSTVCYPGVSDTLALNSHGVTGIVMVSLLVCLIPTTIGALLSAIGIAGMDRLVQRNVLAMSGRAVEAAGDVNTLLLDKTGTITLGNRQAAAFLPLPGGLGGCGAAVEPRRRNARGPFGCRVRQAEVRAAGAHTG